LQDKPGWQTAGEFNGFYRHGRRIVFDYTLGATQVLDSA
jgi:hypothetical protein